LCAKRKVTSSNAKAMGINKLSGTKAKVSKWTMGALSHSHKTPWAAVCASACVPWRKTQSVVMRHSKHAVAMAQPKGTMRKAQSEPPKATAGHCNQPTKGGWSK
jgi:hypothetical protein